MKKRIGWIGTGVMGHSMCGHILNQGYTVRVHNRSREKADDLLQRGAVWCESPAEVAQESDITFVIVGYPADVESVILGPNGALQACRAGHVLVDMTTSDPSLAQRIHTAAARKEVQALDAPVSGGDVGARDGTLAIMVGGDKVGLDEARPLLELLGSSITHMGPSGTGQHTKMCNQILNASTMIGVVESLLYAQRSGMNMDQVIDVIGSGAAASWAINNLGRRIAKADFTPGFFIKHFVKDMGIALAEAKRMQLALPGLALANQFYTSAMATGLEDAGTQALYRVLGELNGIRT